jgi:hypothetical protein
LNDGKTKRSCGKEWNNSKRQGVPNRVATRPKDREAHKEAFIQDKAKLQSPTETHNLHWRGAPAYRGQGEMTRIRGDGVGDGGRQCKGVDDESDERMQETRADHMGRVQVQKQDEGRQCAEWNG